VARPSLSIAVVQRLSEAIVDRVCAATGAHAVQRAEGIQRLWSGYGEIARLWLSGGARTSVIVKRVQPPAAARVRADEQEQQRSHARKLRSYAVEMSFYQRYASRCSDACRVAHALTCERMEEGWLFVLEDLDAAGFGERRAHLSIAGLRACLRWLAHFHATFLGESPAELWPVGTYWHLGTRPDELARGQDPELRSAAHWLDARLRGAQYRTLLHGDAKVENFCFAADLASVAAVDFQYVGGGCGMQDVAYFFSSCLNARACETQAPALLDYYFQVLQQVLTIRRPNIDAVALEVEWRALYPVAWADFCRFMDGWAPEQNARAGYAGRMTALALEAHATSTIVV
jgi:hypothetical protein